MCSHMLPNRAAGPTRHSAIASASTMRARVAAASWTSDTDGGNTLLSADYAAKLNCKFWGRTMGYNIFGKRADGPHCDNVQIKAGDMALSSVSVGTIDFGDRFITLDLARSRLWLAKAL